MLRPMAFKLPESVLVVVYTPRLDVLLLERNGDPASGIRDGLANWTIRTWRRRPAANSRRRPARGSARSPTGARPTATKIWAQWRARYAPDVTHNVEHVFGFQVPERTVATLDPTEHVAQLWLPWQDATWRSLLAHQRDAICSCSGG